MRILIIVLTLLLCNVFYSQQTKFPSEFKMKSSLFSVNNYGKSTLNIYYQFTFSDSGKSLAIPRETICILQTNDNFTKFSDLTLIKLDSLREKFSHQDFVDAEDLNQMLKYKILWGNISLKKLNDKIVTHQNRINRLYEYDEEIPDFKWQLEKGQKKILGYDCKKASVKYRGRNYIAWYSTEIPINNGPYVFQGLPGLILEIEDVEQIFHFLAQGIDKNQMDIYLEDEKGVLKVSRQKLREIRKTYYENPGAFHGNAYNEDGSKIITKSNPIPYNPIELE